MAFTYINPGIIYAKLDLGIETAAVAFTRSDAEPLAVYCAAYDDEGLPMWPFHKRTDGYISGTTIDENSAVMTDVLITCLWNKNMAVVGTTKSDGSGTWTIRGLDPDDTYGYTIVAQDPLTGTVYNTVSYDKITPVAG